MKDFFKNESVQDAVRDISSPFEVSLNALKQAFYWAAGFSLVLNILQLTVPLYMMQVLDRVASSGNVNSLYLLTGIAAVALLVSLLLDIVRSFVLNRASSWLETRLSIDLFPKAALAYHSAKPEEASALEELWRLRSFMSSPAILSIFDAPWMIFYFTILYMLAVPIGIVATIGGILLLIIAVNGERAVRSKLEPTHANTRRTRDYLTGIQFGSSEIMAMGMLEQIERRWIKLNIKALQGQYMSAGRASVNLSVFKHARLLLQLGVLFVGSALALTGDISIGVVIGASIIMSRALGPIEQSISSWKQALSSYSAYKKLRSMLGDPPIEHNSALRPEQPQMLTIEDVSYAFPGRDKPFLKDLTFRIEPGEVVVLIGPSGAGKSVLSRLVVGNHRDYDGRIHIGDYELSNFSQEEIGPYIGYVAQRSVFIKGTIAENIGRFGSYSTEEIVSAARRIGAHETITQLPKGYDTEIGGTDGHPLSGGQEQRIAIARALCGQPGMLVLDEPNLNLDVDAEALLFRAIQHEKKRGTTVLVVSHQQNMIEVADKIALMRGGLMVKFGPKDDVLAWLRAPRAAQTRRPPPGQSPKEPPVEQASDTRQKAPSRLDRDARKRPHLGRSRSRTLKHRPLGSEPSPESSVAPSPEPVGGPPQPKQGAGRVDS